MVRTGRPRGFDPDEAVARARDVFWSRGYTGTSVQDLVDALGVQRGSLYATFGDKHDLYLRAVDLYWRENRARLEALLSEGPVLPTLRAMLTNPATVTSGTAGDSPTRRGCLVGNTTAELTAGDDAARSAVAGAFSGFVEIVAAALRRAQLDGEVSTAAAPEAQAALLLVLFQGAALVARGLDDQHAIEQAVDLALTGLQA